MLTEEHFDLFRKFRIRAMGDKLREMVDDPAYDDMTFEDKMAELLETEASARRERKIAKLNREAGFKLPAACVEDIVYLPDRKLSRDRVARYASCKWVEDNEVLVIISKTGCGKSYLCQALSVDKYPLLLSQRYVRELSLKNPLPLLLIFTVAVIAALYWFFGTEKGSSLRATGANPSMARAQGINTNSNIVLGLMLSNGLVALSGALLAQYQGSSDINMGRGAIVIGLAAVIIGEVIFGKVFMNFGLKLFAVSIGAIIYYIVLQIVLQLGLNTNDLKLITALIVAIFLAIPYWKSKMFRHKVQPQNAKNGGNGHA